MLGLEREFFVGITDHLLFNLSNSHHEKENMF